MRRGKSWRVIPRPCSVDSARYRHQRTSGHGVVERATPVGEPVAGSDRHLHGSPQPALRLARSGVDGVAIGVAEHKQIDVTDGSVAIVTRESRRPRSEDECRMDSADGVKGSPEDPWHAERFDQHV